jgi:hypothetical protein
MDADNNKAKPFSARSAKQTASRKVFLMLEIEVLLCGFAPLRRGSDY